MCAPSRSKRGGLWTMREVLPSFTFLSLCLYSVCPVPLPLPIRVLCFLVGVVSSGLVRFTLGLWGVVVYFIYGIYDDPHLIMISWYI